MFDTHVFEELVAFLTLAGILLNLLSFGEVQVRRVYPDIFDACSATYGRQNLNLL